MNSKDVFSLEDFISQRKYLMNVSYRILGSIVEAEEIVQEVYIKWMEKKHLIEIKNHKAWLVKVCTNLSLDRLRRAYKKREDYIGPWLPEPVVQHLNDWSTLENLEVEESLSISFLLLLEKLSPKQRAVYLLNEVFEYNFNEISEIMDLSPSNCRKILQRSRASLESDKIKYDVTTSESKRALEDFFKVLKESRIKEIKSFLDSNIEFWADGGGKVIAARKVLSDTDTVTKFMNSIYQQVRGAGMRFELIDVNAKMGLLVSKLNEKNIWQVETIFTFEFLDNKIARIYAIRNPDKLPALLRK